MRYPPDCRDKEVRGEPFWKQGVWRGVRTISPISKGGEEIGVPGCITFGLLSSGGYGFWNQSLSILEEIRKTKKLQVQRLKTEEPQE